MRGSGAGDRERGGRGGVEGKKRGGKGRGWWGEEGKQRGRERDRTRMVGGKGGGDGSEEHRRE